MIINYIESMPLQNYKKNKKRKRVGREEEGWEYDIIKTLCVR